MKTAIKPRGDSDDFLKKVMLEMERHNGALEIIVRNTYLSEKQVDSFNKFRKNEEQSLKTKIKTHLESHQQNIASDELIKVRENQSIGHYSRLRTELILSFQSLILSEMMVYNKKIADFILSLKD